MKLYIMANQKDKHTQHGFRLFGSMLYIKSNTPKGPLVVHNITSVAIVNKIVFIM